MKRKPILMLVLAISLLILPLTACGGKTAADASGNEPAENPNLLTNIYREEAVLTPPDDFYVSNQDGASVGEDGTITCLGRKWSQTGTEYARLTFAPDGSLSGQETLDFSVFGEDCYPNRSLFCEQGVVLLSQEYDEGTRQENWYLHRIGTDGKTDSSDELGGLFGGGGEWFFIQYLLCDGDGYFYLVSDQEILILDPNFIRTASLTFPDWISSMTVSADGTVYVFSVSGDGCALTPIDRDVKAFGKPITLDERYNDVRFGADGSLYCVNKQEIAKVSLEDGTSECIMSFDNSGVLADNVTLLGTVGADRLLFSQFDPSTFEGSLRLYREAPDVDLSQVRVLSVVSAYGAGQDLLAQIAEFNKAHPDVRVVMTDYSVYATEENNWDSGGKLELDLANGLIQPDVLVCDGLDAYVSQIVSKDLFVDLAPCLEKSGRADDLLGCVRRSFETEDGQLWALPGSFSLQTMIGTKAMLGERSGNGGSGWTLGEMLDFAESLPAGTQLLSDLSQEGAAYTLLGTNGYGAFVDTAAGTASFDGEDFIAYLEFLSSLPKTVDYNSRGDDYYDNLYLEYYESRIALKDVHGLWDLPNWIGLSSAFGTEDFTVIGYPDENRRGTQLNPYNAMMILGSCAYPDDAWAFLESVTTPEFNEQIQTFGVRHGCGFPIYESMIRQLCASYENFRFRFYANGSASYGPADLNEDFDDWNDTPCTVVDFDESMTEDLLDFLNGDAGSPVLRAVPEEITNMVNEEVSVYLSGTRSAEETARILQSRVTIWLAEHAS